MGDYHWKLGVTAAIHIPISYLYQFSWKLLAREFFRKQKKAEACYEPLLSFRSLCLT